MGLINLFIKNLIDGTIILSEVPFDKQQEIKDKLKEMVDNGELDVKIYNRIVYNCLVNPDLIDDGTKNNKIVDMDIKSFSLQGNDI